MTVARKFIFDDDFEVVVRSNTEKTKTKEVEDVEPEIIEPEFKDYHLEEVYDFAFNVGKEEGRRVASSSTESNISDSMVKMLESLSELFRIQEEANAAIAHDAMAAAIAISRKVLPRLGERNALDEVERMVEMTLGKVLNEPQVVVRVNSQLHDPMLERIEKLTKDGNFEGKLILQADDKLPLGDCRIEWNSGGADRDMNALWREIDEIIRRNFGDGMESEPVDEEPPIQSAP